MSADYTPGGDPGTGGQRPPGGLPRPRLDQLYRPPAPQLPPGTSAGTLRARQVIVGGSGGPAVTGVFVYNGNPGPTTLVGSVTNSAADPFGTATYRTVTAYQAGLPRVAANLSAGALQFQRGAGVVASPAVIGSNDTAQMQLSSGQIGGTDLQAQLVLVPAAAGVLPAATLFGGLQFTRSLPLPPLVAGANGPKLAGSGATGLPLAAADTSIGDGQIYGIAENGYWNTAAVPIPASGFTTVFSQPVAAITYMFRGKMRLKQGAAGSIPGNIGFTGPATSFGLWDVFWRVQAAATTFESQDTVTFATQVNVLGAQAVAGDEVTAYFDGTVTFTAAGTFAVGCQADGVHPFTAQPGCKLQLRPIG